MEEQNKAIDAALEWIRKYRPEIYEQKFIDIVDQRRRLLTIENAKRNNPAVALYGESQKGKSYLVGNLLKSNKEVFKVDGSQDVVLKSPEPINFVKKMNPTGDGYEATGVVSRFTSYRGHDGDYKPEYPLQLRLLKVSELAAIICDGYCKDVSDAVQFSADEIREKVADIEAKYKNAPKVEGAPVTAEDILDLEEYTMDNFVGLIKPLSDEKYFKTLALRIDRIPVSEYKDVFSTLWYGNADLTAIFSQTVTVLEELGFARSVYTSLDSAIHNGNNEKTILSVDCLRNLDVQTYSHTCSVLVGERRIDGVRRCELAAVTAEAVFKIGDDYLNEVQKYVFSDDAKGCKEQNVDRNRLRLPSEVRKDIFERLDLLDFPGARSRGGQTRATIGNSDEKGYSNRTYIFLRGKVAYLFSSLSKKLEINILTLCHDNIQISVQEMWQTVDKWVKTYIGEDAKTRARKIEGLDNISPLFVVCTKFNSELVYKNGGEDANSETICEGKWKNRGKELKRLLGETQTNWMNNWTGTGKHFNNTYLLRDYAYSTGAAGNCYKGYDETVKDSYEETPDKLTAEYYSRLRETFRRNEEFNIFFADPEKSFDLAASMNNDGSLWIIENLTNISKSIGEQRDRDYEERSKAATEKIRRAVEEFYHGENDADEELKKNLDFAFQVKRERSLAGESEGGRFFWGKLLKDLMMTEDECLSVLHRNIRSSKVGGDDRGALIVRDCGYFKGCGSREEKKSRLMQVYAFGDWEEAEKSLSDRGLDFDKIVELAERDNRASVYYAHILLNEWCNRLSSAVVRDNPEAGGMMSRAVLMKLVSHYKKVSEATDLCEKIAKAIEDEVNIPNPTAMNQDVVADIASTIISDFVYDLGVSEGQIEGAKKIEIPAHLIDDLGKAEKETVSAYDDEVISGIFDSMRDSRALIARSFETEYDRWFACLVVSLVSHLGIEQYDRVADEELGTILSKIG
ncbi:MAG: hypothetical protein II951_05840 [Bacteroidales bacterium]|nr:hypothetical protein [Bacteroidales bacterium]